MVCFSRLLAADQDGPGHSAMHVSPAVAAVSAQSIIIV